LTEKSTGKITIILSNAAYDRVSYALCIAQAALSSGMEVYMLLVSEALGRFTRGRLNEIGDETPERLRAAMLAGLDRGSVQPLDEQVADAKHLGLKIYACPNAMATFEIAKRDLIEVDEVMGLTTFITIARGADVNWYI